MWKTRFLSNHLPTFDFANTCWTCGIVWSDPSGALKLKSWWSNLALCFLFLFDVAISCPLSHCHPCGLQALLVRALLEYSQNSESSVTFGLTLAAGIFLTELIRSWTLALMWAVNYRTAARLRGAALTFAFNKILNLRSTKKVSLGEVLWRKPFRAEFDVSWWGCKCVDGNGLYFGLLPLSLTKKKGLPRSLVKRLKRPYPFTNK